MSSQDDDERAGGKPQGADDYAPASFDDRQRRRGVTSRPVTPLSPRERSVLSLICCGLSTKHIARELNISPETVKTHAKNILTKLHAKTRAEAVGLAAGRCLL